MDTYQAKIFYAVLLAGGVIAVVVLYFFITIVRTQRRNLHLHQSNLLLEINTLENERKRIVSDLHDELGPLLSVVKFQVSGIEPSSESDAALIEKATANLDTILERIRNICNHLVPQVLGRKGLIVALSEFLHEVDRSGEVNIEFRYQGAFRVPAQHEIHLYRMLQEMVNNVLKHANASNLLIDMRQAAETSRIVVSDDGKGFDMDTITAESMGLGLRNILSRSDIIQADLYLQTSPGNGTTYTIEIPTHPLWKKKSS